MSVDLTLVDGFAALRDPSIVVEAADGSLRWAYQASKPLYPASMIKAPLAAALAIDIASGRRRFDEPKTVDPANMTTNDAESPLEPGYGATLGELAELMITRSDNVATNELIDVVGRARVTLLLERVGLLHTAVRRKLSGSDPLIDDPAATGRNAHPADDCARLLRAIAADAIPFAAWLHDLLARQVWNTKLSRGLEPGDRFAHKTGDTSEASHDGGILETAAGRRYIVVVYTAFATSDAADDAIAAFMRGLRPHL